MEHDGEVAEGLLRCAGPGHLYPIVHSIPRLTATAWSHNTEFHRQYRTIISQQRSVSIPDEQSFSHSEAVKSFGHEWTTYHVQRPDEDRAYFCSKTGTDPTSLTGKRVLDAGCGSGRYARVAGEAGAEVIAVDLSSSVETAALVTKYLQKVHIVQADIFSLPFAPGTFDFVYSIGVLHHTPNTKQSLDHLIPLIAYGGGIAIWLYPRWPLPIELYNRMLRAISTHMSLESLHRMSVILEPIGDLKLRLLTSNRGWKKMMGQILRGITIGVSYHPDREIRICDTFDWFSPRFQWHHTDVEVEGWLREYGLTNIQNLSVGQEHYRYNYGNGVNFTARRPPGGAP